MSKIYQSSISTSHKNLDLLKKELSRFLSANTNIHCKALKRNIALSKLPEVITNRKSSAKRRLQCFNVAVDILKHARHYKERTYKGFKEYSIIGHSANGFEIEIHLREERTEQKDRKLFFISCFYK